MSDLHHASIAAQYRYALGSEILKIMQERDELPLPNIYRVAKVMQEVFIDEGMVDRLNESGYKWRPKAEYWRTRMSEIADSMRKEEGLFFVFVRDQGQLKGQWRFVGQSEFEQVMKRDLADIETRGDTYNNKAEDGMSKWPGVEYDGVNVSRRLLS